MLGLPTYKPAGQKEKWNKEVVQLGFILKKKDEFLTVDSIALFIRCPR